MSLQNATHIPADGVAVQEADGALKITLYKVRTADVVSFKMPLGSVEKADIVANFDYYFNKAAEKSTVKVLELAGVAQ